MSVALPSSLPDALAMLAERPEAVPVAGGTDLFVHWPARVAEHDRHYMDLSGIAELKTIAFRNGELVLGALATYWEVIHAGRMREGFPLLVAAFTSSLEFHSVKKTRAPSICNQRFNK